LHRAASASRQACVFIDGTPCSIISIFAAHLLTPFAKAYQSRVPIIEDERHPTLWRTHTLRTWRHGACRATQARDISCMPYKHFASAWRGLEKSTARKRASYDGLTRWHGAAPTCPTAPTRYATKHGGPTRRAWQWRSKESDESSTRAKRQTRGERATFARGNLRYARIHLTRALRGIGA